MIPDSHAFKTQRSVKNRLGTPSTLGLSIRHGKTPDNLIPISGKGQSEHRGFPYISGKIS